MKKIKKNIIYALEYKAQNPNETNTKIAQIFGIDRHTISDNENSEILKKLTLIENDKDEIYFYGFTELEFEIIDYYSQHSEKPYRILKEKYPSAPGVKALRNWMDIMGKTYHSGPHQKYHYNRSKFKDIMTEEDAYWLGFITADGCIFSDDTLQIKLQASDRGHLVKFLKYLDFPIEEIDECIKDGFGGAYTKDNPVNTVKICSTEIVTNLQDKGIFPRKSGNEIPYICKTKELEKAYIRGLIDGDGWIGSTEERIGIVGSKDICSYVKNFIQLNITDVSTNNLNEKGSIWGFTINNKKAKYIIDYFYKDSSIYLDRKYKLYQTLYLPCINSGIKRES